MSPPHVPAASVSWHVWSFWVTLPPAQQTLPVATIQGRSYRRQYTIRRLSHGQRQQSLQLRHIVPPEGDIRETALVDPGTTPSDWISTTASGASHGTYSSTPNVMPALFATNAAPSVAIVQHSLTRRKDKPNPASKTQSVLQNIRHEENPAAQYTSRQTNSSETQRRQQVTQSLVRHLS